MVEKFPSSSSRPNRFGEEESQSTEKSRNFLNQCPLNNVSERGHSQGSTGEQRSQSEIKRVELHKDINLSRRTKVKDFIRLWACGVSQKECRLNMLNDVNQTVEEYNSIVRKELQENLNNIPEELRRPYQSKIDTLVEVFQKAYNDTFNYGPQGYRLKREFGKLKTEDYLKELSKYHLNISGQQKPRRPHL